MKMKNILFTFITLILAVTIVEAQNVKRLFQYVKLPDGQAVLEVQSFGAPIAADTNHVLSANAGNTSAAAVTVSSFAAQPDVPRNLVITPGGTTADVAACTVVVNGTDILNHSISENFAFLANASSATTGSKAFKTVTSIVFPAACEDSPYGASWSVGVGEKLGLNRCMADAGSWFQSSVSGVHESTLATIAASASTVSLNTADFNGTMNGSATFKGYFVQNHACY